MATAYDSRYGYLPQVTPEPLPVLAQVFNPDAFKNIADKLKTITVPQEGFGLGTRSAYEKISPEFDQYANRTYGGMGTSRLEGYTLPTDQTFQGKPLEAKYDSKGNFINLQLAGGNLLYPDPNQPNIAASPKFNKSGGIIDYGVFDLNQQDDGGFGSFIGGLLEDFGPMILAGLSANVLAGSGLLGGGAAAGTGGATALSPYAAQAAGAYGGSTAAATAAAGGSLTGIQAANAAQNTLTQAANAAQNTLTQAATSKTGLTFGQGVTPTTPTSIDLNEPLINPTTPTTSSGSPMSGVTPTTVPTTAVTPTTVPTTAVTPSTITPSMLDTISKATGISVDTLKTFGPSVIQGLIGVGGSYLTSEQAKTAAQTQADAQIRAAQIAADAARFRPVGVTTRFGSSNFTTDAAGNVVTAGYTPSAEITGYQDRLRTLAGQGMTDVEAARAAYQPLTGAAQNLFSLGQSYLAKTPEQAAQEYISKQTALLAPSRENQLAELRNRQFQTGRGGVAVSQGGNLMATSPELAAYYNSLAQSDLVLAAQADQEAQNRIKFGAGLFDTGANLQGRFYSGQTAAYSPFTTAMDTSSGLESLAQVPLTLSTQIGAQTTAGAANAGRLTGEGIMNAARTMAPANAYSLGGNLLSGAANSPVLSSAVNRAFGNTQPTQQQYTYDPVTKQFVPVQQFVA